MGTEKTECVPAVYVIGKKKGKYAARGRAAQIAREELTKRDGPRPFPKAVCRHLCENDSTAPNGFVCTLHTTWGTQKENCSDKSEEVRRAAAIAGAKISGKVNGKKACSIERTCPHCGRTIRGPSYFQHERACKMKP